MAAKTLTTRLRFEVGEHVPADGESFIGKRELSGRVVLVTVRDVSG